MRSLLPSRTELAILGTLAVLCTGIAGTGTIPHDLMLAMLAMPIFVIAAVMGLRRSPQWADSVTDDSEEEVG